MESEIRLSEKEQLVVDYYSSHKASRNQCCKELYGRVDYFLLQDLSNIESGLRKKGFLFYCVNGVMVNIEDEEVEVSDKLKIQRRLGGLMIGITKSNVRIVQSTRDPQMKLLQASQMREMGQLLLEARRNPYAKDNSSRGKQIISRQKPAKKLQGRR